jgi:hypothetical protein
MLEKEFTNVKKIVTGSFTQYKYKSVYKIKGGSSFGNIENNPFIRK